jgi:hypothetical protein
MEQEGLKIPLTADENIDFEDRNFETVNKLFKAFLKAQNGEEVKFIDGDIKALRFSPDDSDKNYISRQGLAKHLDYNEDYVSYQLSILKKESEKIYLDLLEECSDLYNVKYYRISEEKIAESLITATEEFYFELDEDEKQVVTDLSEELFFYSKIFWEFQGELHYTLLHNFARKISNLKANFDRLPEKYHTDDGEFSEWEEVLLGLVQRYESILYTTKS